MRIYSYNQIKNHAWFKEFNWDFLELLSLQSGYKPKLEDEEYILNIEKYEKVLDVITRIEKEDKLDDEDLSKSGIGSNANRTRNRSKWLKDFR